MIIFDYENTCSLPKSPGCYLIKNVKNGKCYVGMFLNIRYRLRQHLKYLEDNSHSNSKLQSDYLANPSAFKMLVLKYFSWLEYENGTAHNYEHEMITKYNCIENGYNQLP